MGGERFGAGCRTSARQPSAAPTPLPSTGRIALFVHMLSLYRNVAGYLAASLVGCVTPAGPAFSQTAPAEIVVTGSEDVDARHLTAFSQSVSVATSGQMARFQDPVCPASIGLDHDYSDGIAKAVARVVLDAGGRVGKPGCHPNLTAVFVSDGQAFVKSLFDTKSPYVATMTRAQHEQLLHQHGPTFASTSTELVGREGDHVRPGSLGKSNASTDFLQIRSASIIFRPTRQDIDGAVVIIETRAAVGKSLRQLADYVAMRGLAKTREASSAEPGDTILRLFSNGSVSPPAFLTPLDAAYLRAVYEGAAPSDGTLHPVRRPKTTASENADGRNGSVGR